MKQHVKEFIDGYAASVVWTAHIADDDGEVWFLEELPYITDDDLEDATHRIKTDPGVTQDCERFIADNYDTLEALIENGTCPGWDYHGHDFHLTRDHHGAGFWDRGYGTAGDLLTQRADEFGEDSHSFWIEDSEICWEYIG